MGFNSAFKGLTEKPECSCAGVSTGIFRLHVPQLRSDIKWFYSF